LIEEQKFFVTPHPPLKVLSGPPSPAGEGCCGKLTSVSIDADETGITAVSV